MASYFKETDLSQFREPIRYDDPNLTIDVVQDAVESMARKMGVPITKPLRDKIQCGNVLHKSYDDCFTFTHPDNIGKYANFVIRVRKIPTSVIVFMDYYYIIDPLTQMKKNLNEMVNPLKQMSENDYYALVGQMLDEVFA